MLVDAAISHLFITRMGFYPKALYHYCQRPTGMSQVILIYCTDGLGWIQVAKDRITPTGGRSCTLSRRMYPIAMGPTPKPVEDLLVSHQW